jgi:hypothetical protein
MIRKTALILNKYDSYFLKNFLLRFLHSIRKFYFSFSITDNPRTESNEKKKDILEYVLLNPINIEEIMVTLCKELGQNEGKRMRMIFLIQKSFRELPFFIAFMISN